MLELFGHLLLFSSGPRLSSVLRRQLFDAPCVYHPAIDFERMVFRCLLVNPLAVCVLQGQAILAV